MTIRFSLIFFATAILGLLCGLLCDLIGLAFFAEYATQLGLITLLSAFVILLISGFNQLVRLVFFSIKHYFSYHQRAERKLLYQLHHQRRLNQLFNFKKARLLYITHQKRKAFFIKHEQKHQKLKPDSKAKYP